MRRSVVAAAIAVTLGTACGGESTSPGDGTSRGADPPETPPPKPSTVWRSVALGSRHACGLTADGTAYCWGNNGVGQLGDGTSGGIQFAPVRVKTDLKFGMLALGWDHSCALTAAGETYCWGNENTGLINDRTTMMSTVPARVVGVPAFQQIAAGFNTCGLTAAGAMTCWQGSLIPVPLGLPPFQSLVLSTSDFCGLTSAGEAYRWGSNGNGQLGRLGGEGPVVVGESLRFRSLAAGKGHMCGATVDGVLYCWRLNARGQLGIGRTSEIEPVTPVPTSLRFDAVSVGAQSSCGLVGRTAYCWGYNAHGQLGDGTGVDRLTPTPVAGGHEFAMLDVGDFGGEDAPLGLPSVTCGVTVSGEAYCWGYSGWGQLGAGPNPVVSKGPVRVAEPAPLP